MSLNIPIIPGSLYLFEICSKNVSLWLGKQGDGLVRGRISRRFNGGSIEVDHPDIIRDDVDLVVFEEGCWEADDVRCWSQEQLFTARHGGGEDGDDGEHVLQWVDQAGQGEDREGESVEVPGVEEDLPLQQNESDQLECQLHPQQLQGEVQGEVAQTEPSLVREGEEKERTKPPVNNLQLQPGVTRDWDWS